MLTKKISKIFEDFSIQFEELLFDYETYEEPLLVNTCSEMQEISKEINFEDLNTFFFNLALAHLNNTILYARKNLGKEEFSNFFICITTDEDENEIDSFVKEFGSYMFRFFITRKNNKFNFSEEIKKYPIVDINNYPVMKKTLIDLNLIQTMDVHLEHWTDKSGDEIKRFFFLYKEDKF